MVTNIEQGGLPDAADATDPEMPPLVYPRPVTVKTPSAAKRVINPNPTTSVQAPVTTTSVPTFDLNSLKPMERVNFETYLRNQGLGSATSGELSRYYQQWKAQQQNQPTSAGTVDTTAKPAVPTTEPFTSVNNRLVNGAACGGKSS